MLEWRGPAKAPRTERTLVLRHGRRRARSLGMETLPRIRCLRRPRWSRHDNRCPADRGPARDVILIGAGQTDLEKDLAQAATAQGRTITPDAKPERGLFYRATITPSQRGVPTLLPMGIGGGAIWLPAVASGRRLVRRYRTLLSPDLR